MIRTGAILILGIGILSTGCMTLRDRIAIRYGLQTSQQKGSQLHLARQRAKLPASYESEFEEIYARSKAHPALRVAASPAAPKLPADWYASQVSKPSRVAAAQEFPVAVAQKPVVVPTHPNPALEEMSRERTQFHARLTRYEMEREAARYRWEASLLRMQSEQLREQVASLDATWKELNEKVARMESDRGRIRESMAKVEEEMERARARAAELQAKWSEVVSALPSSSKMDEAH